MTRTRTPGRWYRQWLRVVLAWVWPLSIGCCMSSADTMASLDLRQSNDTTRRTTTGSWCRRWVSLVVVLVSELRVFCVADVGVLACLCCSVGWTTGPQPVWPSGLQRSGVQIRGPAACWFMQANQCCPLTKLDGGLSRLHSADEDAVSWLTNYDKWHAYEKKKKCMFREYYISGRHRRFACVLLKLWRVTRNGFKGTRTCSARQRCDNRWGRHYKCSVPPRRNPTCRPSSLNNGHKAIQFWLIWCWLTRIDLEEPGLTQLTRIDLEKPGLTELTWIDLEEPRLTLLTWIDLEEPGLTQLTRIDLEEPGLTWRTGH